MTAPLSTVLLASTDALYSDLYQMAHGELSVTTTLAQQQAEEEDDPQQQQAQQQQLQPPQVGVGGGGISERKEKMSNLSFAQRRHELAWRLAVHSKALTHVSALTASAATSELGSATSVSTKALQHARTAWVQADEAQDALYFFHAQLFPARQATHDVYGSLDTIISKRWVDLPRDLKLIVDRYENSNEKSWSEDEVAARWHMSVRDKLVRGEIGWMRLNSISCPWKLKLRGGIVRLTHGTPKSSAATASEDSNKLIYPLEAVLTVVSTDEQAEWTLMSVEVHVQARTGESNHQLDTTNRQRYDLHRLCALAMAKEEAQKRKQNDSTMIPRPLHALFQVANTFALSWQLEVLSAQAQALRRGIWVEGSSNPVTVTPVHFADGISDDLGEVAIHFWNVDDRYGPPSIGELSLDRPSNPSSSEELSSDNAKRVGNKDEHTSSQLTLVVKAKCSTGISVSLSGAESIMNHATSQPHIQSSIQNLLEATSDPFSLSASQALFAATRLCAERRCYAMVQALIPKEGPPILPSWVTLSADHGSITVSAKIQYDGIDACSSPVVLFRLACDARTGSFIPIFPRATRLLQLMACNDTKATELTALRIASVAKSRSRAGFTGGRAVKDAFEGLSRSMNALGQRVGVGGKWDNIDAESDKLRHRAIRTACTDVRSSIITCCGMSALYGLAALAFGVATGIDASPDMAGESLGSLDGVDFIPVPPISLLIDQELIETSSVTTDGEKRHHAYTVQELFGVSCAAGDDNLTLYAVSMKMQLDTPTSRKSAMVLLRLKRIPLLQFVLIELILGRFACSFLFYLVPTRNECKRATFKSGVDGNDSAEQETARPKKKIKVETSTDDNTPEGSSDEIFFEVNRFSDILCSTLEL